jgi:hypothetical protein
MSARAEAARFILAEAAKVDLRIGTDGHNLFLVRPRGIPRESYFSFQRAIIAHHDEIIEIFMREGRHDDANADRDSS